MLIGCTDTLLRPDILCTSGVVPRCRARFGTGWVSKGNDPVVWVTKVLFVN